MINIPVEATVKTEPLHAGQTRRGLVGLSIKIASHVD
jgi:hypothetical protein